MLRTRLRTDDDIDARIRALRALVQARQTWAGWLWWQAQRCARALVG